MLDTTAERATRLARPARRTMPAGGRAFLQGLDRSLLRAGAEDYRRRINDSGWL